jgi:hypothetical protein
MKLQRIQAAKLLFGLALFRSPFSIALCGASRDIAENGKKT